MPGTIRTNIFLSVVLFPLEVPAVKTQSARTLLLYHVIRRPFGFPKCTCGLHSADLS